jgi:hypothetical protein
VSRLDRPVVRALGLFGQRWVRLTVAASVTLVVAAGAAAYFTSTGSGSGNADVGSPAALTITATTPTTGLLYPGGTGEVDLTISNPNTFSVRVNSLVLGSSGIESDQSGCDTDNKIHFDSPQTNGGSGWTVPAGDGTNNGTLNVTLSGAINMDSDAENECQGATFTVHLETGP